MLKRYPKEVTCQHCGKQFLSIHYYKAKYCGRQCAAKSHPGRPARHGLTFTTEHAIWRQMKQRCYNPRKSDYCNYGARGIRICDRWLNSFENFYSDMGPRPSMNHTVDRIDGSKDYGPDNCRWATKLEQARNRRGVSTPAQDQIIRDGVARGLDHEAIAALVGRTPTAVRNRAYRIGLNFGGRHPSSQLSSPN